MLKKMSTSDLNQITGGEREPKTITKCFDMGYIDFCVKFELAVSGTVLPPTTGAIEHKTWIEPSSVAAVTYTYSDQVNANAAQLDRYNTMTGHGPGLYDVGRLYIPQ